MVPQKQKTTSGPEAFPADDRFGTIAIRIAYRGVRHDLYTTGIQCWRSQLITGNANEPARIIKEAPFPATDISEANTKLAVAFANIMTIHARLRLLPEFSFELLRGHILGDKDIIWRKGESTTLLDLAKGYLGNEEKRYEAGEIKSRTLYARKHYIQLLEEYLMATRRLHLPVSELKHESFDEYRLWLHAIKKFSKPYSAKCLQYARQALRWGKINRIIPENPLAGYVIKKYEDNPDTTHLEQEHIEKLIQFDPYGLADEGKLSEEAARSLDQTRDIFLFMIFTGMHYVDYDEKNFQLIQDKSGQWIKGTRQKTSTRFEVPLDRMVVKIIRKYGGIEKLPTVSNKTLNQNLKTLAILAEIEIYLTSKIGRKTFADRTLNDMDMEAMDVAAMLGHSSTKTLKHYARIQNRRIMNKYVQFDMQGPESIRRLPIAPELDSALTSEQLSANRWVG